MSHTAIQGNNGQLLPTSSTLFASSPNVLNNLDEDVSYKSFSRDSGHGGSEQEDSPRTHWTNTHQPHHQHFMHQQRYTNSLSADIKNSYIAKLNRLNGGASDGNSNRLNMDNGNHLPANSTSFQWGDAGKQNTGAQNSYSAAPNASLTAAMKATGARGPSPWNHTYMEIDHEGDPVYEEIERERWGRLNGHTSDVMQVSDLSDEELKRNNTPSDMSRNSSRGYGDSRPLLPYYSQQQQQQMRQQKQLLQQYQQQQLQQQQQQQLLEQEQFAQSDDAMLDLNSAGQVNLDQETLQRMLIQQHQDQQQMQQLNKQQQQLSRENLMTVAVLNGEQVVCRLSSPVHQANPNASPMHQTQPQQYQQGNNKSSSASNASSVATSPASNGMPAHIVISRASHMTPQQQLYNES